MKNTYFSRWKHIYKQLTTINQKVWFVYLTITRIVLSFLQVYKPHLGTVVIYKGSRLYISNMKARPNTEYTYILRKHSPQTREEIDDQITCYDRSEFKIELSFKNILHNAFHWWTWYETSWLSLDCRSLAEGNKPSSVRILGSKRARGF